MANTNVVIVYDKLEAALTKLEKCYTLLEEQQQMISRLDKTFDTLYARHGKETTFVSTLEDKIQNMAAAVKNDMADIDYLKNMINYIIQSYTDAEGKTTLRSNELLMSALGSLVPYASTFTTSIYQNMNDYTMATMADPTKVADVSQYQGNSKAWITHNSTNATTADAWDAVHDNASTNGESYSYRISTTGSKISSAAENVAVQDTKKDIEEAEQKAKEAEEAKAAAEKEAEEAKKAAEEAKAQEEAAKKAAEEARKEQEAAEKAAEEARKEKEASEKAAKAAQAEKKRESSNKVYEEPVQKEEPEPHSDPIDPGKETPEPTTPTEPTTPEEPTTPDPVEPTPGGEIGPGIDPEEPEPVEELPTPEKKSSGNKVVPIIAGVAAAGAAGVGAKVFLDKKSNNDINDEYNEESEEYASSPEDSYLDSSDEFTYKTDLDENYIHEDTGEDNFSDITEEEEVQGYQAINFNDISETH